MEKHLINYFSTELGLGDYDKLPSLELCDLADFSLIDMPSEPYITLHPFAGWSVYKNWSAEHWAEVIAQLPYPVYQIGTNEEPKITGARHDYMGKTVLDAVTLMVNAKCHMGVDSFTNHVTHFTVNGQHIPAVILWGSTQAQAAGYTHNLNLSAGLSCQPCFREDPSISVDSKGPCNNPLGQIYTEPKHECMNRISVGMVVEAVKRVLSK
jgi:ADP-heptose:LPS heptosyltransferase